MQLHNVQQGSAEWHALRAQHFTASEAQAMMGASPYTTRTELLRQKATGIVAEVDDATQRRFDAGHNTEALFRPVAEEMVGDDLFPCTGTLMVNGLALLASFDGLTMDRQTVFEHKLYKLDLAKHLDIAEEPPEAYIWQLEQQLLVSGAERALFVTSNGTAEQHTYCWYESKPERRAKLIAGWKQFAIDLANYQPTEAVAAVVAGPVESLPAVSVRLNGALAVVSNLPEIGAALRAFIDRMVPKPETDQQFADAEAECKALKKAEDALEAAEAGALAELSDVDAMRRAIADLRGLARSTRLAREKLVAAEKENRKADIVAGGVTALRAHLDALNKRLGKPYMPGLAPTFTDFGGAIKGKKNLDSMQGAVNDLLAKAKIEANAIADRIDYNLRKLAETPDLAFLFSDVAQIVLKAPDDFEALVQFRVADHRAKEAAKLEAQREAIRKEEQEKAEKDARAKLAAEQAAETARAATEQAQRTAAVAAAPAVPETEIPVSAPAVVQLRPGAPAVARVTSTPPTLTLGAINKRLAPISLTAEGLSVLGFTPAATNGAAKLFHEHQFAHICAALVRHIESVQAKQAA